MPTIRTGRSTSASPSWRTTSPDRGSSATAPGKWPESAGCNDRARLPRKEKDQRIHRGLLRRLVEAPARDAVEHAGFDAFAPPAIPRARLDRRFRDAAVAGDAHVNREASCEIGMLLDTLEVAELELGVA